MVHHCLNLKLTLSLFVNTHRQFGASCAASCLQVTRHHDLLDDVLHLIMQTKAGQQLPGVAVRSLALPSHTTVMVCPRAACDSLPNKRKLRMCIRHINANIAWYIHAWSRLDA